MPRICPICGPKLSMCCMLISVCGILFLGILGVFFYMNSALLFEDVMENTLKEAAKKDHHPKWTTAEVDAEYKQRAHNCWVAAGMYAVTLVASFWQNKWNSATSTNS